MTSEPNPYEPPSTGPAPPPAKSARRRLMPVAVALLVTSILHIIGGLNLFAYVYFTAGASDADPDSVHSLIFYCLSYGITMLYCLLLISGAFSMMRQGSYLWAVTVCILAMVPLLGPCYFLAVPFGVWGLIVLRRPDVRDSFRRV